MDANERAAVQCLVAALWALKQDGPSDTCSGICSNLADLLPEGATENLAYDMFNGHDRSWWGWPEASGNAYFPVVGAVGTAADAYWSAGDSGCMWEGEYGSARMRLLNWCIRYWEGRLSA